MDKDVVHTHTHTHKMEYYLAIKKKNEILPFVTTWMNPVGIMLSKISQRKKIPYDFTYMWNLKNKTNGKT